MAKLVILPPAARFKRRIACARLPISYLTGLILPAFSLTLTTKALYQVSLRWFEACSCKPASGGLPPSPV
ncbi:MAG: hypothetical protein KGZ75_05055 [Syntrophomonadaceae bacterium]|jgi:hypothetical protein|nr:hypothetical protein [Syntrophomonadaceae bacterium]